MDKHLAHIDCCCAASGRGVGWRIGRVKERAIDGHQPIAPKERTRHPGALRQHLTALAHHRLQALAAQGLAASTQPGITHHLRRLARMQVAELAHQLVPHLALVQTAPQGHPHHKQHQSQGRAGSHPPRFAAPRLTLLHTPLNHVLGVHLTQHRHAHLFTHLVIDIHLA